MSEKRYIISDASKQVDVEAHVLRYWEEELPLEIPRNEMGHRYYTEENIKLLKNIKILKDQGFQLKAIKMVLPELINAGESKLDYMLGLKEELNNKVLEEESRASGETGGKDEGDRDGAEKAEYSVKDMHSAKDTHGEKEVCSAEMEETETDRQMSEESAGLSAQAEQSKFNKSARLLTFVSPSKSITAPATASVGEPSVIASEDKLQQFQAIMTNIVSRALVENNPQLGQEISERVSDNVLKEMDYLMRMQDEKEEQRFKKLDETIRMYQKGRMEAAAADEKPKKVKKKRRLFRKNSAL